MTGMAQCTFCQVQEDEDSMDLYGRCELSKGKPCSPCKEYTKIQVKILAARKALDKLLVRRQEIRTKINQNHDLITREFPSEVVSAIFQCCAPERQSFGTVGPSLRDIQFRNVDKSMVSGPLILGAVCRAWRDIAWASQPLWTALRLFLDRPLNPNLVSLTREWIDRAGMLPLSIHLSYPLLDYNSGPEGHISDLISIINERSKQWENLDIIGPHWLISSLKGSSKGAPNLQSLRINYHNVGDIDKTQFSLKSKPRPVQLSLDSCQLSWIQIKWDRLTQIFADNICLDECVEILRRAPQLVHCTFYSIDVISQDSFPFPDDPIVYQALEYLALDCLPDYPSQAQEIMKFLASFTFPCLTNLKIRSGGSADDENNQISWDPVVAHVERSSPPLISLEIQHYGEHPITECLLPILQMTPSLRHLAMVAPFRQECGKEGQDFCRLLTDTSMPPKKKKQKVFLPNLQSMEFQLGVDVDADGFWTSVVEIFGPISTIHDPRRRPLKTLRVRAEMEYGDSECIDIRNEDAVQQLLALEREGIILDLKDVDMDYDILEQMGLREGKSDDGEQS